MPLPDNPSETPSLRPFEDLVNNSPRSVAPLLKQFHAYMDPKRYTLADEIHNAIVLNLSNTLDDVLHDFMDTNLPRVLLDIASDPSLYGKYRDNEAAKRYEFHILCSLGHIIRFEGGPVISQAVDNAVSASPKLWKTLWSKAPLLLGRQQTDSEVEDDNSRHNLLGGALVQMGERLYILGGHHSHTGDKSYLGHFMLFAWIMGYKHRFLALKIVNAIVCENPDKNWRSRFFNEALVEQGLVKRFSIATIYELIHPDVMDGDLHEVLVTHHLACKFCHPVLCHEAAIPPKGFTSAMFNITIGCQMNFCMGKTDSQLMELMPGLMTILILVEQNPEYLNRLKRDKMESMQLIQMCARLFPAAAVSGQYIFVESLEKICSLYSDDYGINVNEDSEYRARLQPMIFPVWRPTLEELQRLPLDSERLVDYSKRVWLKIGRSVGLDPTTDNPEENVYLALSGYRHIPLKRCHYRNCFCSSHSPKHTMKMCKGCWRVRYCSAKCQESDWQAGHRELCLSRHEGL